MQPATFIKLVRPLVAPCCVAALLLVTNVALGCPTCKEDLAGDPAAAGLVRGYFWSILFMLTMPYLVFTSLACYFYYEVCKARAQKAAEAASQPQGELSSGSVPAEQTELAAI